MEGLLSHAEALMILADFARAFFALALTLGLLGLCAVGLRRFGPDVLARFAAPRKERRLTVLETLVLDPSRRLVLVSFDGRERLLLLGDGRLLESPVAEAPARQERG
jgi:flagellar protein FliO/FliZ